MIYQTAQTHSRGESYESNIVNWLFAPPEEVVVVHPDLDLDLDPVLILERGGLVWGDIKVINHGLTDGSDSSFT